MNYILSAMRFNNLPTKCLLGATLASAVFAAEITFRVVSPDGVPSVSVNNGPSTPMSPWSGGPSGMPYYTKLMSGSPDGTFTYQYSVGGKAEPFERTFSPDQAATLPPGVVSTGGTLTRNDFFGRNSTVVKYHNLPKPFDRSWNRGWGLTPAFDDSYIPTIWFSGDAASISNMLTGNTNSSKVNLTMTAIFKDEALVLPGTEWKGTGLKKNIQHQKRDFSIKLNKKISIYGRDEWKLKAVHYDPTFMREKIFSDLLHAFDLPTPQMNFVRVYANDKPIGLYLFADDADTDSFFKAEFHGNTGAKNYAAIGSVVKAESSFHFLYNGPNRADYPEVSVQYLGVNTPVNSMESLITKWIEPLTMINRGDKAAVDNLVATLEIDTFLKSMAVEWLSGYWRGAWGDASKFVLYDDPITKKFYYVSSNADETFGVGVTSLRTAINNGVPKDYMTGAFTDYNKHATRPVIQKILSVPDYLSHFIWVTSMMVQQTFNTNALPVRISEMAARIRPEVEWDRSVPRFSPGIPDLYKIADFDAGFENTAEIVFNLQGQRTAANATQKVPGVAIGLNKWIAAKSGSVASTLKVTPETAVKWAADPITTPPTEEQMKGGNGLVSAGLRVADHRGYAVFTACVLAYFALAGNLA